ncbi:MAG: hypothetical protein ACFFCC_17125 [Promethearchaeota archaeon]
MSLDTYSFNLGFASQKLRSKEFTRDRCIFESLVNCVRAFAVIRFPLQSNLLLGRIVRGP